MLALPEGWESDYNGNRWFYRYKPNGLTQFQFPQPGDEFPAFVGDNVELEPEERLQMRRNTSSGSAERANTETSGIRSRLGKEPTTGQDEFAMSATGYFDPSSFMHFGLDDLDDDDLGSNELNDKKTGIENGGNDAELDSASVSVQSPAPTPSSAKSEIAATDTSRNRPTSADSLTEPISPPAELSADNERKPSPVGLVPELAGPHTAKCAEELAPVELDAASSVSAATKPNHVHSQIAELSADNKPREPKPPPPQPAPPPLQPVDSLPLVSASFAYPPVRTVETPAAVTTTKEPKAAEVQVHTEVPRARTMPIGQDQTRYQPFTLASRVAEGAGRQLPHSQRSSMVLSSTTVLQSQNTELGPLSPKPKPEPAGHDTKKPEMFLPPVDPRFAKTPPAPASSPASGSALDRVPQVLPVPPKIPLDNPSPEHSPRQPGPPPLPGSGARHESISSSADRLVQDRVNPSLYYAPSILKPAHRRSNFSPPRSDQPSSPPTSPPKPMQTSGVPSTQREYVTREIPLRQVVNPPYPLEQVSPPHPRARGSLPYPDDPDPHPSVAPIAPPARPPKPTSPERRTPTYTQSTPPHSSNSVPDPLDQIDDVISELNNLMPREKDSQPTYTMPVPRGTGPYTTSPPLSQTWGPRHNSFPTSTATHNSVGIMPSPPSASDSQSQQTPPSKVSPMHTPDMSEQRSQTGLVARQSISGSVAEMPAHASATEASRASHYAFPIATIPAHAQGSSEKTIHSAPITGTRQGQVDLASNPPSAHLVSQETAPSYTSNAARDSTGGQPRPPADRTSLALGPSSPLPLPQSEVSSPSLSVTSLHRAVSTASSQAQTAGGSQERPTAVVSRPASVSGQQQVIHEIDSTPAKMPSSPPPGPVSEDPSPKAKPFPMLPGQVTPMPSQVGSEPVPIPVQPDVTEPTAHRTSSTPPTNPQFTQSSAWIAQDPERPGLNHPPPQSGPAFLQNPVLAGPGGQQQLPPPLPQTQTMPVQPMAPQVYGVQHQLPGLPLNGAAPPPSKGDKGVKKWAKKIFNSSSSKQNATGAGAPGPQSIQQLATSVPNSVPQKALAVPVQPVPPTQAPLAQFNPVVPGRIPTQPPVSTQLSGPSTVLQGPAAPISLPPTSSVAFSQQPGPAPNRPTPQGQPKAGPAIPTNPNGAVSNIAAATATSGVMTAAVSPQAPHRLSLSAAAQSAHPPATSHAHPAPQASGVPRTVAANDAPAPRPRLTNGAAAGVASDPGAAPPSGGWRTKPVDYSGGDWGDGW